MNACIIAGCLIGNSVPITRREFVAGCGALLVAAHQPYENRHNAILSPRATCTACKRRGQEHVVYLDGQLLYTCVFADTRAGMVELEHLPDGHHHPPWQWVRSYKHGDVVLALPGELLPWGERATLPPSDEYSLYRFADGTKPWLLGDCKNPCPCGRCPWSDQPC